MTVKKREGFKFIMAVPKQEQCVALVPYKKGVILATTKRLYAMGSKTFLKQFNVKDLGAVG